MLRPLSISVNPMIYFSILGPLEAWHDETLIKIGGPRQQTILGMLLLEADRVVPAARLIEAVWGDDPPPTAQEQLYICISSLRRAIGRADGENRVSTCSPGYLLELTGLSMDARVFETKVQEGRIALAAGDSAQAAVSMREALSLWRGDALSNLSSALVQRSVTHLNEQRLSVIEECIEIELAAGIGHDLVGELTGLNSEYPMRERFGVLLMRALYRVGRQADALETYRRTRHVLMQELGIEPGTDLRQ